MGMVIRPILEILINGMTIFNGYGHPSMGIYISIIPWVWIYGSLLMDWWPSPLLMDWWPSPSMAYAIQLLTRGTYEKRKKKLAGWWYTYPSEQYESQLGLIFPYIMEKNHVPKHQPASFFHLSPQHVILSEFYLAAWHSIWIWHFMPDLLSNMKILTYLLTFYLEA